MSIDGRAKSYGKIWGGWKIGKLLGTGSGGKTAVFELTRDNLTFTEHCAMKVINIIDEQVNYDEVSEEYKEYYNSRKKEIRKSAEAEVNLMHQLKNSYNVVQYYDFEFNDWQEEDAFGTDLLIRMDYLGNLNAKMKKEGVTQAEIVNIGIDICTALEGCAEHNIIHRDIKPDNIFTNGTRYLLGDFGISKIIEDGMGAQTNKGTAHYAAPEQFANATASNFYDNRVDIYSLALTLYVLANKGKLPFTNKVLNTQLAIQMRLTGTPFEEIEGINPVLMQAILIGCKHNPDERYRTATAFKNALLAVKEILQNEGETVLTAEERKVYETEQALKAQTGKQTEILAANDNLVSYETEKAIDMPVAPGAKNNYETQPALDISPVVAVSQENYETQPALDMSPVVAVSEENYETQPALDMSPVVAVSEENYETQPALEMPQMQAQVVTPATEPEENYETQPALEMPQMQDQITTPTAQQISTVQQLSPSQESKPIQLVAPIQEVEPIQLEAPVQEVEPVQLVAPTQVTQAVEEEAPTEQVQDISLYPPIQLSYVEIENLKSMAKAKVLSDDYEGAYDIFMKLVAAGEDNVMYTEISKIYNSNKVVKNNPDAAVFWFKKCIETTKDSWTKSLAENRLGEIYAGGIGVKRNHEIAEEYFRSSAAKGNPYAKKKFVAGKYVK
ncbi:MAG: protein kinase [Agathobacter sp.]|nr:protein kinase [Agathobacter sp.]